MGNPFNLESGDRERRDSRGRVRCLATDQMAHCTSLLLCPHIAPTLPYHGPWPPLSEPRLSPSVQCFVGRRLCVLCPTCFILRPTTLGLLYRRHCLGSPLPPNVLRTSPDTSIHRTVHRIYYSPHRAGLAGSLGRTRGRAAVGCLQAAPTDGRCSVGASDLVRVRVLV